MQRRWSTCGPSASHLHHVVKGLDCFLLIRLLAVKTLCTCCNRRAEADEQLRVAVGRHRAAQRRDAHRLIGCLPRFSLVKAVWEARPSESMPAACQHAEDMRPGSW